MGFERRKGRKGGRGNSRLRFQLQQEHVSVVEDERLKE